MLRQCRDWDDVGSMPNLLDSQTGPRRESNQCWGFLLFFLIDSLSCLKPTLPTLVCQHWVGTTELGPKQPHARQSVTTCGAWGRRTNRFGLREAHTTDETICDKSAMYFSLRQLQTGPEQNSRRPTTGIITLNRLSLRNLYYSPWSTWRWDGLKRLKSCGMDACAASGRLISPPPAQRPRHVFPTTAKAPHWELWTPALNSICGIPFVDLSQAHRSSSTDLATISALRSRCLLHYATAWRRGRDINVDNGSDRRTELPSEPVRTVPVPRLARKQAR
ncbi:hypothetical protein LY76DRAFT_283044 [Colletotrichum caudatum]|nr:hypothetical protein LY76DRAFT_283044 [Colletotrichum caudatum]